VPQVAGGRGELRVEFDTDGTLDPVGAKHGKGGGKETSCADGRLREADGARLPVPQRVGTSGDLDRKGVRCGKLPEPVAVRGRAACIEPLLDGLPGSFGSSYVERGHGR
jgi:hypothetical protein